ncbi:hypothetical protein D3C77_682400 [compost metagenome]
MQALAAALQLAIGFITGAVGFPTGSVASSVDAHEIDFGKAAAGAATQQRAGVAGENVTVDFRQLGFATDIAQPRHRAEQRQAQGVE